jgi:hypothetical protein
MVERLFWVSIVGALLFSTQARRGSSGVQWVGTEETAIAIGVAVAKEAMGPELVEAQRPFKAKLSKGIWKVSGSLPPPRKDESGTLFVTLGGSFEVHLNRSDGRILKVFHSL